MPRLDSTCFGGDALLQHAPPPGRPCAAARRGRRSSRSRSPPARPVARRCAAPPRHRAPAARRRAPRPRPRRCRRPSRPGRRRHLPALARPERQSLELVREALGIGPMRSTSMRAAAGSRRNPRRRASPTSTRGMSLAFGASNSWISPFAALTASASLAGALARAIRTTVRSGGKRSAPPRPPAAAGRASARRRRRADTDGTRSATSPGSRRAAPRGRARRAPPRPRRPPARRRRRRASARARRRARVASIFAPSVPAIR